MTPLATESWSDYPGGIDGNSVRANSYATPDLDSDLEAT